MIDTYSVPLTRLVQEFQLTPAYRSSDYDSIRVTVEDVSRPGLQLAGYFDHFEPMRLQVLGNVEMSYLRKISQEQRSIIFDRLFSFKIPALIIARNMDPDETCVEMAKKHDITILRCQETTSYMVSSLISYLKSALAPRITRHGVLVDVYGEGLLLVGESGIGKSEAAAGRSRGSSQWSPSLASPERRTPARSTPPRTGHPGPGSLPSRCQINPLRCSAGTYQSGTGACVRRCIR